MLSILWQNSYAPAIQDTRHLHSQRAFHVVMQAFAQKDNNVTAARLYFRLQAERYIYEDIFVFIHLLIHPLALSTDGALCTIGCS